MHRIDNAFAVSLGSSFLFLLISLVLVFFFPPSFCPTPISPYTLNMETQTQQTQQPLHQQLPQQQQQQQHQPATRVVSHWAKSTPEEGIQLIFNKSDTDNAPTGVRILTSPPSIERPCQWDICLQLVSSPFSSLASSSDGSGSDSGSKETVGSLPDYRGHSTAPTPPRRASSQPQQQTTIPNSLYHRSAAPLLVLTLQRASIRLSSAGPGGGQGGDGQGGGGGGGNMGFEDPMNPGQARCDSYRTIYIYSPRLRRDIHVQSINRNLWPQTGTLFILGQPRFCFPLHMCVSFHCMCYHYHYRYHFFQSPIMTTIGDPRQT